jgi:hypothetical protein
VARNFTAGQILTRARQRADREDSQFVTDTEGLTLVSASYADLYNTLVSKGLSYFESTQTITTDGTANTALPSGYLGTIGVDYQRGSSQWSPLYELMPQERNRYGASSGEARAYRVVGSNITLYPTPPTGQTYRHLYVPAPADLTSSATSVDGVSGFEEYVVLDVAIKMLHKEESSATHLERERARILERIEEAADHRRMSGGGRVVDVGESAGEEGSFWPYTGGGSW